MPLDYKILSTKPLPPEIRAELSEFPLQEVAVIRIESNAAEGRALLHFLKQIGPQEKLALVVTSRNALPSLEQIEANPFDQIFCVGEKTAIQLLDKTGWNSDQVAGTAKQLVQQMPKNIKALVYPCSAQRLDVIPEFCRQNDVILHEFQVYQPVAESVKINGKADIICFFSPSGVRAYYGQQEYRGETTLAIGPTTGKELENYSTNIVVSEEPSLNGMVREIKQLYSSKEHK